MKDELVSFEVAKLAKEKGFNLKCYWFCTYKRKVPTNEQSFFPELGQYKDFNESSKGFYEFFSLPTQSLLQRWLREVHNIEASVLPIWDDLEDIRKDLPKYYYWNYYLDTFNLNKKDECKTYEEALEKGLKVALELIK